jgi:hypothetical protein
MQDTISPRLAKAGRFLYFTRFVGAKKRPGKNALNGLKFTV